MSGNAKFEIGQDTSAGGMRGSMVHKIQRPRARQGPLSSVRELLDRRRANVVKTRGIGRVEHGVYTMVRDLLDRWKTHHR